MGYQEYHVPLEVQFLQHPALDPLPVRAPLDFLPWAQRLGRPLLADLSSLRVEVEGGRQLIPVQFSPAADFEAAQCPRGELTLLAPARLAPRFQGTLVFGATDDLQAPRLPYPPRSYRPLGADGRAAAPPYPMRLQLVPQPGHVLHVEQDGRLVTAYQFSPSEPRPYLFPLIGPAGRSLTRLGHPHDPTGSHSHHHSVWTGFRGVNGENFWEETRGGRLFHRAFPVQESGSVYARFLSEVSWETRAGNRTLREEREVTVCSSGVLQSPRVRPGHAAGARILDFRLRYRGVDSAVTLDRTSFGFLAVRVAESMGVFDGGGVIRNSEGGINEPGVFWKPARWCDYSGPVTSSEWNGIAFLDHPGNPHHPTPWHVRPDGWMGAAFATAEGYRIAQGGALELRYRLLLHGGDALEADVEAAWHDYAHPPRVTLGSP